jgi:hypothetical protein
MALYAYTRHFKKRFVEQNNGKCLLTFSEWWQVRYTGQEVSLCNAIQITVAIYTMWTRGKSLESINFCVSLTFAFEDIKASTEIRTWWLILPFVGTYSVEKWESNWFNLLKPTGYVMHQQFNIQQLYVLPTLYLCVLFLSENKQLFSLYTAITYLFL